MIRGLLLGVAAIGMTGIAATVPAAQAARDWTKTVATTPAGGYRIGNPEAAIKLVEYGSLTCGACANFAAQGMPPLIDRYVKSGKVSFEFRNFVRDPADMAAALLSRCAAPAAYFALTDRYFKSQQRWIGRIQAAMPTQQAALEKLPPPQRVGRFAMMGGLDAVAAQDGVTPAKAKACLADPKGHAALVELRKTAIEQHQVDGTPTFLVNGAKAEHVHDWAALEQLLAPPGS